MGIKDRRDRQRSEVRRSILTSARELALTEGWQSVTIRKIADRIEYSPPVIYEHFDSKEEILLELLREGYRLLHAELSQVRESIDVPEIVCMSMAHSYWNFAWNNPELYQVMNGLDGVPFGTGETPSEARDVFMLIRQTLHRFVESSGQSHDDLNGAVDILWSIMHGLTSLTMAGRIFGGRERASVLLDEAVKGFLSSLGKNSGRQ